MRILLVGGAGNIGRNLTEYLYQQGHTIIIVDKNRPSFTQEKPNVTTYITNLMDMPLLKDIAANSNIVINLAWSFSDKPEFLFNNDIVGHINLLKTCANAGVKRFIYTSTASVYGSPLAQPINEEYFCRPECARKPLYAIAKLCAEQLALTLGHQYNMPITIFRFWWAFGDSISGKHLHELIRLALSGQALKMVRGTGGTFVSINDLGKAAKLAAIHPISGDNIYNIGSLFLTWEEIGQAIIELTKSTSRLQLVDASEWDGPAFLNETWHLSWDKATTDIGYKPLLNETDGRAAFRSALANCIDIMINAL